MKRVLLTCFLASMMFAGFSLQAQNIKKDANGNYAAVKSAQKEPVKTGKTYTDAHGNVWPVYQGSRGGLYALVTSKTGNVRKQYLKQN